MKNETPGRMLRVLHVILNVGETNSQYNEHCLPMVGKQDLAICTYFPPQLNPPAEIRMFPGNGHLLGFFRSLSLALKAGRYDVLNVHAPQTSALVLVTLVASLRIGRMRGSMVYTVHDSFYDYKLRNQALMVVALVGFKRVIFCSGAAYESLPRVWKWIVRDRWHVVQNAADFERIDRALTARPVLRDETVFEVLSVGRLEPVKDPITLLNAFAQSSNDESRLVLIGVGSQEAAIRSQVARMGLEDRVRLTGLIPRDEVFVRCAGADVLVSTSLGEGLPVAVIEAMAAGCPVILSDIPPHRELVDGEDFIPLIATGDTEGFAREIRRFREMPSVELRVLGRRCREHVLARFALSTMHAGIKAVYDELPSLAQRSAPSP